MNNKILAFFGIGAYILSVLSSAEDLQGNSIVPDALIVVSGLVMLTFIIMSIIRLWRTVRIVSVTFIFSAMGFLILQLIQTATSPTYGSPIIIFTNVFKVIYVITVFWTIVTLFQIGGQTKNGKVALTSKNDIAQAKVIIDSIHIVRKSLEAASVNLNAPKTKLVQCLFYAGMIDAASQMGKMSDDKFMALFSHILDVFNFEKDLIKQVFVFHQKQQLHLPAYKVILDGGQMYANFIKGNTMIVTTAGNTIKKFIDDPAIPPNFPDIT